MSIFDENLKEDYPAQQLIKNTVDEYFKKPDGWVLLSRHNPNSKHLGYLALCCRQALFNIETKLFNDYGIDIKNVIVEYVSDNRYKFYYKFFIKCNLYPADMDWNNMSSYDKDYIKMLCYQDKIPGKTVLKNIDYVVVEEKYCYNEHI